MDGTSYLVDDQLFTVCLHLLNEGCTIFVMP